MINFQILINRQMISLILIGIISLIVIAGTGFLFINKNEELNEVKKSKILLIVGLVIFISFIVTTFKHRNISFASNRDNNSYVNLGDIFFKCDTLINQKDNKKHNIPVEHIQEFYGKNYRSINSISQNNQHFSYFKNDHQQNIIYLSQKDAGASYFMANLASNICQNQKIPIIYLKLGQNINNQDDFLQMIGIQSFQTLQNSLCHYSGIEINQSQKHIQFNPSKSGNSKRPYIIIDNYEHILNTLTTKHIFKDYSSEQQQQKQQSQIKYNSRGELKYVVKQLLISKMFDLIVKCKVNLILNSQSKRFAQRLYEIWETQLQIKKMIDKHYKDIKFPFQFHIWQGFRHYDVYKIINKMIPGSDSVLSRLLEINKKQKYNFRELYALIDKVQEGIKVQKDVKINGNIDDKTWRQWTMKMYVAEYLKLGKAYQILKNSQNKKISYLKNVIALKELYKLEQIGLVKIQQGLLALK